MKINPLHVFVQILAFLVIYVLPVFLPGGIQAWPGAWVYLSLWLLFWFGICIWLFIKNPGLFNERMRLGASNQQSQDRIFAPLFYGLLFSWLFFMSLDANRFHWSTLTIGFQVGGCVLLIFSFYLYFLTFRENTYLSPVVRIQEDRGQRVISSGPYRYVRHPMYAATLAFLAGTPLLLGSWYGILAGILPVMLLAWRTVLEERALRKDLSGYESYMAKVKYRFIPYVW